LPVEPDPGVTAQVASSWQLIGTEHAINDLEGAPFGVDHPAEAL
jgi:hypothetical protein